MKRKFFIFLFFLFSLNYLNCNNLDNNVDKLKYISIQAKTLNSLKNFKNLLIKELDNAILFSEFWYSHLKDPSIQDKLENLFSKSKDNIELKLKKLEYLKIRNSSYLGYIDELIARLSYVPDNNQNLVEYKNLLDKSIYCLNSFFVKNTYPDQEIFNSDYKLFEVLDFESKAKLLVNNLDNIKAFREYSKNAFTGLNKQNFLRQNWLKYSFWTVVLGSSAYLVYKNKDNINNFFNKSFNYLKEKKNTLSSFEILKYKSYLENNLINGIDQLNNKGFYPDPNNVYNSPSMNMLLDLKRQVLLNKVEDSEQSNNGLIATALGILNKLNTGLGGVSDKTPAMIEVHYLMVYRIILDSLDAISKTFNVVKNPLLIATAGLISVYILRKIIKNYFNSRANNLNLCVSDVYKILLKYNSENKDLSYTDKGLIIYFTQNLEKQVNKFSGQKKMNLFKLIDALKDNTKTVYEKISLIKLEPSVTLAGV